MEIQYTWSPPDPTILYKEHRKAEYTVLKGTAGPPPLHSPFSPFFCSWRMNLFMLRDILNGNDTTNLYKAARKVWEKRGEEIHQKLTVGKSAKPRTCGGSVGQEFSNFTL